jgi:Tfp pilus assembly protein PilP
MVARKRLKRSSRRNLPQWLVDDVRAKIREEIDSGYPIKQAIAIAYSRARKEHPSYKKELTEL